MQDQGISKAIPLLGGNVEIVVYGPTEPLAEVLFDDAQKEALRLRKIFDFFDPESELSRLNKERSAAVSKELSEVISMCLPYCALTYGEYDITKGGQILQRKRGMKEIPSQCSYRDVKISGRRVELTHPDVLLDLGSAAKGFIGDALALFLKSKGVKSAFLDLRGDLVFFGGEKERIDIEHPREKGKIIRSFEKADAGVATSGDYRQYYGNYERSHIINSKDLCSVTVVADSLTEADISASCIYVTGTKGLG